MEKIYKSMLIGVLIGLLAVPQLVSTCFAAASGNYTDLLPIGAAGNTTVISNGSGWSLTTLPPTQTFGDSLSRLVTSVYQSTGTNTINATTTLSTFTALGVGGVGSTTFPAAWVAAGRSIETIVDGTYSTANPGPNWTWALKLATTTILSTGAQSAPGGQALQYFKARSIITVVTSGSSGAVFGSYEILVSSGSSTVGSGVISFSTAALSNVSVDLTSQLTVNPTFTWGTANSSVTVRNVSVRFLN